MKITGELLKSERTRKNLSVQDVAFALKLSPKIITAIESGETESLPAKTFIRGFVKSYAQFLKIDVDQVMRQFQEEMGSTHPMPKGTAVTPANHLPSETNPVRTNLEGENKKAATSSVTEQASVLNDQKSGRSLLYIGVAVVLVILIVATNRVVDRYQKEGVLNPQDISKVQPLNPNQQSIPQTPTSTPEAGGVASQPPIDAASSDVSAIKPTVPQPLQSTAQTTTPASTPTQAASGDIDDGFEPSSGKPVELILEAKKDIEILYARGNTKTFSKLKLTAKQVQVIRSTTGLHIKSEDGGAFHMVVNGVDKGLAGAGNKPVRLSF